MLGLITSIVGLVFVAIALVVSILVIYAFVKREIRISKRPEYSIVMCGAKSILVICALLVAVTLGWLLVQDHFNQIDDYENPKQKEAIRKIMATTAPTEVEIRANTKKAGKVVKDKHKESLSDFDKAMAAEAKKIKERNK